MTVKELISVLERVDPNTEVVIRNIEAGDESNAYKTLDIQEGFFDELTGEFTSLEEIEGDDGGVFGEPSYALCVEIL